MEKLKTKFEIAKTLDTLSYSPLALVLLEINFGQLKPRRNFPIGSKALLSGYELWNKVRKVSSQELNNDERKAL